jgi:hypothetical protein
MRPVLARHLPPTTLVGLPQTRQLFLQHRKSLLMILTGEMCHNRKSERNAYGRSRPNAIIEYFCDWGMDNISARQANSPVGQWMKTLRGWGGAMRI